jgi:hypothetical protein
MRLSLEQTQSVQTVTQLNQEYQPILEKFLPKGSSRVSTSVEPLKYWPEYMSPFQWPSVLSNTRNTIPDNQRRNVNCYILTVCVHAEEMTKHRLSIV